MGEMQATLEHLLRGVGRLSQGSLRFPTVDDVASSKYAGEIEAIYRRHGGVRTSPPLNLRSWDIEFDGFAVELDEYLHFNRYRAITLEASAYRDLSDFPLGLYRAYCSAHEARCLKAGGYGGKWSNSSCESQFGPASKPKDLSGNGAPRWKQRAFYDFVKDLSPLLVDVAVLRIAVWDVVTDSSKPRTVEQVLSAPSRSSPDALAALLRERAGRPTSKD